ncbi:MAG: HlyC/CorC family transporter, partial [Gammaproteobacteria bacterium]|nr:HlyC/CorC family transporter [Gammaproteobacteria bacterium]
MSGFFSGSETALISLNRHKLKYLVKSGHKGAIVANWLLERPDRLIGLILIFNNFVNILASSIATILGLRIFGEPGIAIATGLLTFIILIFSEVTPKTYAAINPEKIAFPAAYLLKPLLKLTYPLVFFINILSNTLLRILNLKIDDADSRMSKEELRSIVNETNTLIPSRHQKMLISILDLEAVTVEDIMVPRHEIQGINIQDEEHILTEQLVSSLHTRLPVYDGDIDKLIGVIHLKNALPLIVKGEVKLEQLLEIMREPYFIPESTSLHKQLLNFQKNKRRVGFVVNEYGEFQGLVTLEDILEEIVGEFTTDPSSFLNDDIYPQEDGSYLLDASINLRDLNKAMDWELPTETAKT